MREKQETKCSKVIIVLALLCSMLMGMFTPIGVSASSIAPTSGTCGNNARWSFVNGRLTISGSGPIQNYHYLSETVSDIPWEPIKNQITSLIIQDGITLTTRGLFRNCPNLKHVSLSDSLKSIDPGMFLNCSSLTSIRLPKHTVSIGALAFHGCSKLKTIQVPKTLKDMGHKVFIGTNLTDIYYEGNAAAWNQIIWNPDINGIIHYPSAATVHYNSYGSTTATSINISGRTTMCVGETQILHTETIPFSTNSMLTWSSSNSNIAAVNFNGQVTAKSIGNVTITAKIKNTEVANSINISIEPANEMYSRYSFYNGRDWFGYDNPYWIPLNRYLQAGYSTPIATTLSIAPWGGNCFGMSASSILFNGNVLKEERYNANILTINQFGEYEATYNTKLREMIELFQVSQNRSGYSSFKDFETLRHELDNGHPTMLLLKNKFGIESHAVVVYDYYYSGDECHYKIDDCSLFINELRVKNNSKTFYLRNTEVDKYKVSRFISFNTINNVYQAIRNENNHGAASLFSDRNNSNIYLLHCAENLTITNSQGTITSIIDGELINEASNIKLTFNSDLSDNNSYTIIAPTDTYTITGTSDEEVTTVLADDYMSVEITHKSSVPVTVSANLHDIKIENSAEAPYKVKYTTYDNVFDEMTVSGTTSGTVQLTLDNSNVTVIGANSVNAVATVSGVETTATAENINGTTVISCTTTDENTSLQISVDGTAATDAVALATRQQMPAPEYSLPSGEYTGGQTLTFTADDETIIYYTTDGSIPTKDNGILYSLPIDIKQSVTIKAIATKYGYADSDILELNYTLPEVQVPFTNLEAGSYDRNKLVELGHEDDVEIYYTMDGSDPAEYGRLYTAPITIYEDTTLKACAVKNEVASDVLELQYIIDHAAPFYFSESIIDQDGAMIDSTNMTNLTKVTAIVNKTTDTDIGAMFILGIYDENDVLLKMQLCNIEQIEDGQLVEFTTTPTEKAKKIKLFAWENFFTIRQLCDPLIIE